MHIVFADPATVLDQLPAAPGSYALRLVLARSTDITVGRLGTYTFPPGHYLYLGSAFGPGGLRARLSHHLRAADNPHWHIDYLRRVARLEDAWLSTAPARLECCWSQAALRLSGTRLPGARLPGGCLVVRGFGASDCPSGCPAHLVAFADPPALSALHELFSSPTG